MIKLTNYLKNNSPVWICASMVQSFEVEIATTMSNDHYTRITLASGQTYNVKETPDQLLSILRPGH